METGLSVNQSDMYPGDETNCQPFNAPRNIHIKKAIYDKIYF